MKSKILVASFIYSLIGALILVQTNTTLTLASDLTNPITSAITDFIGGAPTPTPTATPAPSSNPITAPIINPTPRPANTPVASPTVKPHPTHKPKPTHPPVTSPIIKPHPTTKPTKKVVEERGKNKKEETKKVTQPEAKFKPITSVKPARIIYGSETLLKKLSYFFANLFKK